MGTTASSTEGPGPAGAPAAAGAAGRAELGSFRAGEAFDVAGFKRALDAWLEPWRMQSTPPWLVGWYNSTRDETAGGNARIVDMDDGAVAFAICSLPRYMDVIAEHYARSKQSTNVVDATTNEIIELMRKQIPAELDAVFTNTDVGPPYYHVQTIGAICGQDEHLEAEDIDDAEWREDLSADLEEIRDPKMWGTDPATRRKIFGVNVHPTLGGWYAFRIMLVLRGVTNEALREPLVRPAPLKFLETENAKRILREYNMQHDLCRWRDLTDAHPPSCRYAPDEYLYFTETKPDKRTQFLNLKVANMAEVPKLRA